MNRRPLTARRIIIHRIKPAPAPTRPAATYSYPHAPGSTYAYSYTPTDTLASAILGGLCFAAVAVAAGLAIGWLVWTAGVVMGVVMGV